MKKNRKDWCYIHNEEKDCNNEDGDHDDYHCRECENECKECYKRIDGEHIITPIRDISFLVLNCSMAFKLMEAKGHEFSKQEKETMKKLFDVYAPQVHYWSSGQFYDMPKEEYKNFKYKHKPYL